MIVSRTSVLAAVFAVSAGLTTAANCDKSQGRQDDLPSGQTIANALTKLNSLDTICSNDWPPKADKIKTYNEGSMIFNVTRSDTTALPADNNCKVGFQNIIDQCITGDDYWGGDYEYDSFTYAIYNSVYPKDGLPPWDESTSSSTGSSTTSSTSSSTSSSSSSTNTAGAGAGGSSTAGGSLGAPSSVPGETVVTETNSAGSAVVGTVRLSFLRLRNGV